MYENLALGYRFEFRRQSSNVSFEDDNTLSRNIIIIDIKNTIGLTIYSIKMNEAECIKLIDYITGYAYDFYSMNPNRECEISISNTTNGKHPVLYFHDIDNRFINNPNYKNATLNEYRSHILTIYEVDMINQNRYVQILTIPMSDTEVSDFAFNLYFNGLIDLVLPTEVNERLDLYMGRIFGDNWHNTN